MPTLALAYQEFKEIFTSLRFGELAGHGVRIQRPLWASTSTKDPNYSDTLYVDELIGPNTVQTLAPASIDAFRDHGTVELTVEEGRGRCPGRDFRDGVAGHRL